MARRAPVEPPEPGGFVMTPMIDVTFQLLIFFMLVLDMSTIKVEELTMPVADKATKDKTPDPDMIIVNIRANGEIVVDGKPMWNRKANNKDDLTPLEDYFKIRRGIKQYADPGDPSGRRVKYSMLIRADRGADWIHVQKVMMIASQLGGVFRVELGARMPQAG
jgi:biopolymer transport protein ExbD